jgi:hypothetical protein
MPPILVDIDAHGVIVRDQKYTGWAADDQEMELEEAADGHQQGMNQHEPGDIQYLPLIDRPVMMYPMGITRDQLL